MKILIFTIYILNSILILAYGFIYSKNDEIPVVYKTQFSPRDTEYFSNTGDFTEKTAKNDHSMSTAVNNPPIDLHMLLNALKKLLTFLLHDYQQLNLDAVLGTRIAEGQLKVLLRSLSTESFGVVLPPADIKEIYHLMMMASKICEMTIPNLMLTTPDYFKISGHLLEEGFWELNYPTRNTNPKLVYPVVLAQEAFNESISDKCIFEMLGSGNYQGHPCLPSDACWDIMTAGQTSRYSLTHQIIYLQVGEVMGCQDEMKAHIKKRNQGTVWQMGEIFCANVLREMKDNYARGLTEHRQDLFMEQAAICGILGFRDLFTMKWLKDILSWQKPEGCYGTSGKFVDYHDHTKYRVKREERQLRDGCLSHKSAVAVAALALYVRYLVEDSNLSEETKSHYV